jgi:hypothetical protein
MIDGKEDFLKLDVKGLRHIAESFVGRAGVTLADMMIECSKQEDEGADSISFVDLQRHAAKIDDNLMVAVLILQALNKGIEEPQAVLDYMEQKMSMVKGEDNGTA